MTSQDKTRALTAGLFATVGGLIVAPMVLPHEAALIAIGVAGGVSFAAMYILTFVAWIRDRKADKPVREVHRSTGIQVIAATLNDAEEGDAR